MTYVWSISGMFHLGPRVSIDSFYISICFTSTKRWSIDIRNTTIILDLKLKRHAPNFSRNYVDKHVGYFQCYMLKVTYSNQGYDT